MKKIINGEKFVVSYSGGKDSTLALYKGMKEGYLVGIIVMMEENEGKSRAHRISTELLIKQAEAFNTKIYLGNASWENYEKVFIEKLREAKKDGAQVLVTGDIDMPEHGSWYEKVGKKAELEVIMPLWEREHEEVVKEFINLGFITKITTVNLNMGMKKEDLGKVLTLEYMEELERRGIDSCGENGEFHTTVIDGPCFKNKLVIENGEITKNKEFMYLELKVV